MSLLMLSVAALLPACLLAMLVLTSRLERWLAQSDLPAAAAVDPHADDDQPPTVLDREATPGA